MTRPITMLTAKGVDWYSDGRFWHQGRITHFLFWQIRWLSNLLKELDDEIGGYTKK